MYILKIFFCFLRKTKPILDDFIRLDAKWFAFIYLCLIPLFGTIYYFNINDFYQSSNIYERETKQRILNNISFSFNEILNEKISPELTVNLTKKCSLENKLWENSVSLEKRIELLEKLNLQGFLVSLHSSSRFNEISLSDHLRLKLSIIPQIFFDLKDSSLTANDKLNLLKFLEKDYLFQFEATVDYSEIMTAIILDKKALDGFCNLYPKDILIDDVITNYENKTFIKLDAALKIYRDFQDGKPAVYGSNVTNIIRMMYFSTVTITTLGYGDLVPISNTARVLVSIESILGIIFIGLFLNAVSHRK